MEQAERDAGESEYPPAVFHRRSRREWLTIMKTTDFLELLGYEKKDDATTNDNEKDTGDMETAS